MKEPTPIVFAPGLRGEYYVDWPRYTGSHNPIMYIFRAAGFRPYFFQPDWRQDDPLKWASEMAEFAATAAHENNGEVVMAGYSAGGLTAVLGTEILMQSPDVQVGGLGVFSFSPWFGKAKVRYAHQEPDSAMHIVSEKMKANLCELELPKLACPVQLYVGTNEIRTVRDMHEDALGQWPQAVSIKPPCEHNIFDESYLNAISHNIGKLAAATLPTPSNLS